MLDTSMQITEWVLEWKDNVNAMGVVIWSSGNEECKGNIRNQDYEDKSILIRFILLQ